MIHHSSTLNHKMLQKLPLYQVYDTIRMIKQLINEWSLTTQTNSLDCNWFHSLTYIKLKTDWYIVYNQDFVTIEQRQAILHFTQN